MSKRKLDRADYMSRAQRDAIYEAGLRTPRTHQQMKQITGVSRPGKTGSDRANRGQ